LIFIINSAMCYVYKLDGNIGHDKHPIGRQCGGYAHMGCGGSVLKQTHEEDNKCHNLSFGLATKARGCGNQEERSPRVKRKEARESRGKKPESQKEGSPGAKANTLEGCGPRGGSPGVITHSRESKEVRGSVRE
jgi:hypothetical protein